MALPQSSHNFMMPNMTSDLDRENIKLQADKEGLKVTCMTWRRVLRVCVKVCPARHAWTTYVRVVLT